MAGARFHQDLSLAQNDFTFSGAASDKPKHAQGTEMTAIRLRVIALLCKKAPRTFYAI
jgi:hypothetical protein